MECQSYAVQILWERIQNFDGLARAEELTPTYLHPVWQAGQRQPRVPVAMPSWSDPQAASAAGKHLKKMVIVIERELFPHFRLLPCAASCWGSVKIVWMCTVTGQGLQGCG